MLAIGIGISPMFMGQTGILFPPPPYIIAATDFGEVSFIGNLIYFEESGPSDSSAVFRISADGLSPAAGDITVTPSTNLEVFDGSIWTNTPFTIPYIGNALNTDLIYSVRLKAGLAYSVYNETLTLSGGGATDTVIPCSGEVEIYYIHATGGTETDDGDYRVLTFTSSNSLNIAAVPASGPNTQIEYLIVAGGGGSSASDNTSGIGGGGAGGLLSGSLSPVVTSYSATVGAGGAKGAGSSGAFATKGSNSTIFGLTAIGGGIGKSAAPGTALMDGGSGGGNARPGSPPANLNGGTGTPGQGNNGGGIPTVHGSGGGGAGAVGNDGNVANGKGGNGLSSSISGAATFYAGGGGAGGFNGGVPGAGGSGGGATGATSAGSVGTNGTANTGGGAGGAYGFPNGQGNDGGNGGSGIIIVRFKFQN